MCYCVKEVAFMCVWMCTDRVKACTIVPPYVQLVHASGSSEGTSKNKQTNKNKMPIYRHPFPQELFCVLAWSFAQRLFHPAAFVALACCHCLTFGGTLQKIVVCSSGPVKYFHHEGRMIHFSFQQMQVVDHSSS